MSAQLAWANLMQLVRDVENRNGYSKLDTISKRVLEWVSQWSPDTPLYVQTVITKSEVASPASLHKSLSVLQNQGLLSFQIDPEDSRRRIVTITSKARSLLNRMSRDLALELKKPVKQ